MSVDRFEKRKVATRQCIQETFIAMLQTRGFDTITVREIAEEAGIGFKTFYRHYPDKTALTHAVLADFVENLQQVVQPPTTFEAAAQNLRMILTFVQANANAVRAIGHMPNREDLARPIVLFAFSEGMKLQSAMLGADEERDQLRQELVAHHFVHAQLELFFWWASKGQAISLDEMAETMTTLILRPIWEL